MRNSAFTSLALTLLAMTANAQYTEFPIEPKPVLPHANSSFVVNIDGDAVQPTSYHFAIITTDGDYWEYAYFDALNSKDDQIRDFLLIKSNLPAWVPHAEFFPVGDTTFIIDPDRNSNIEDIIVWTSQPNQVSLEVLRIYSERFAVFDVDPLDAGSVPDNDSTTAAGTYATIDIGGSIDGDVWFFSGNTDEDITGNGISITHCCIPPVQFLGSVVKTRTAVVVLRHGNVTISSVEPAMGLWGRSHNGWFN